MKKWLVLLPLAAVVLWSVMHAVRVESVTNNLKLAVESAVLLDAATGEWLYSYHGDEELPPASMSKMMTEQLVLDDIASGRLKWNDRVSVSEYAAAVAGAGMGLEAGQKVAVKDLFEAMAIHSANDAAVALAETTAKTEQAFVERMNRKAAQIGLSRRTEFANATGLSREDLEGFETAAAGGETVMTAKDVALLASYLIRTHPEVLETTRRPAADRTDSAEPLRTTNEMLPGQRFGTKGNDGLKTGYTKQAGYCFTGTTKRNGRRLVTVVMGAATPESRFEETRKLLEYGWRNGG